MERTVRLLKFFYYLPIGIALIIVVLFESDLIPSGGLYREDREAVEFIVTTVMELLTICVIPLSLRLFKFGRIKRRLCASPASLLRYGSLRLALLTAPMVVNTLLYYLYVAVPFGYLAIILLIAGIFVYPSKSRCMAETSLPNTPRE